MASKKRDRINYLRGILQWTILVLLVYMLVRPLADKSYFADFEANCPFGGMQALMSYLSAGSLACSMTTVQIGLGLALLAGVLLFAKLFCSYICPIGTFTEWLATLGRRLKVHITLKGFVDRDLRILKYALLFFTVYFSVTSSELFCRTFDPYFAVVSGFGTDVVLWYAIPALLLTVVGSFFIRQFWCKYICPLGAITNIAVYALPVAALALIWVILNKLMGDAIHWSWLLGAICLTGFILEATTLRFLIFPPLRIVRNAKICTGCKICDKKCPMAINISSVDKVQDIDCHLCTDCIVKCPEAGALTINRRWPKWLPALLTVVLIALALLISNKYEIPTITERWASSDELNSATVFEMDGLKNIKCFGSSRSFANHMKEVPGVLGIETFVKHHRVKVLYNNSLIDEQGVKKAIFSPVSEFFSLPVPGHTRVSVYTIGIDRCFDPNDQYYLTALLYQQNGILGFQTHFGEPVEASIYFDDKVITPEQINKAIEQREIVLGEGADRIQQSLNFKVNTNQKAIDSLTVSKLLNVFYQETDITFNFFEKYSPGQLGVWEKTFVQASFPEMQDWIPYLISHTSNDDGIVRFSIVFTDAGPLLRLIFVKSMTSAEKISKLVKESDLQVHFPDGKTEKVKNPFRI
jgi:hypothetical protein